MLIQVTEAGELQLQSPLDFERFAISVDPRIDAQKARSALSRIARLEGECHAWVAQDGVRSLAAGEPGWEEGFSRMVDYAARKGWLDERGGIRAHIENVDALKRSEPAPAVDSAAFKAAMRNLAGGVAIVATGAGEGRQGLTISAITSVSAEPPCVLVCVNTSSNSHDPMLANRTFAVSLLGQGHEDLALRFAGVGDIHGEERFEVGDWESGVTGSPLLASALCTLECELVMHQTMGSHGIFIGKVIDTRTTGGAPLVNFQGKLRTLSQELS